MRGDDRQVALSRTVSHASLMPPAEFLERSRLQREQWQRTGTCPDPNACPTLGGR